MMDSSALTTTGLDGAASDQYKRHICPWWYGYILANPLRKLIENPNKILGAHVRPGMRIVDFGAAMGFFSLPLARMAGDHGHVVCIDVQARMIAALRKRAARAGLADCIETIVCTSEDLGLKGHDSSIDLVLAMYVLHEVPNLESILSQLATVLKPGGRMLVAEPKGHVSAKRFNKELDLASSVGLRVIKRLPFRRGRAVVLENPVSASM
ncbi:MAG: class I SAM-dependent methyltransferase [Vicinamibacteria bacterium]|nr:class I SAM-dependent methyltransferase [Vicinamibacteria bacterium]